MIFGSAPNVMAEQMNIRTEEASPRNFPAISGDRSWPYGKPLPLPPMGVSHRETGHDPIGCSSCSWSPQVWGEMTYLFYPPNQIAPDLNRYSCICIVAPEHLLFRSPVYLPISQIAHAIRIKRTSYRQFHECARIVANAIQKRTPSAESDNLDSAHLSISQFWHGAPPSPPVAPKSKNSRRWRPFRFPASGFAPAISATAPVLL